MSTKENCAFDGERPLTTSSRDTNNGYSERSSISLMPGEDGEFEWSFRSRSKRFLISEAQGSKTKAANLTGSSVTLDPKQLDVLKDFLFDPRPSESSSLSGKGFQRTTSKMYLFPSSQFDVESIFETTFDLTEDRLRRLFDSFDGNNNGTINYEELKLGFAYHGADFGMSDLDDRTFQGLVDYLDADKSGEITFEEFSEGIRLLMLRTILRQVHRSEINRDSVITQVFDYNIARLERYLLHGNGQIKQVKVTFVAHSKTLVDFFLHERGDDVSVRWINITGEKASNIMKMMALKYRLHPLALEDALECTDHRPKADTYDGHYFIMVPVFYLNSDAGDSKALPVAGKPIKRSWWNLNETNQTTEDEKLDDSDYENLIGVHMTSIFITKPNGRTVITFNNEHNEERCWYKLQEELKKDYSKLRQYDGQYLAYRLLDESVDKIGEIVKKLKKVIKEEKKSRVRENYQNLDRIHSLKQQMYSMSRKFKPFLRLLVHVIEDDSFSPGASIYLRDVLDNLEIHDDDVKELIATCDSVDTEAEKLQAKQMDSTLYTLTVFTVTILPAQFLTGKWIPCAEEYCEKS